MRDFGFAYIRHLVEKDWAPEQIRGRLRFLGWQEVPSVERIYQFVLDDKRAGGMLYAHLRCQKQHRKRYGSGQQRRGQLVHRRDIDERPKVVEKRYRFGDFEGDTVIGHQHKDVLLTLVEHMTRLTIIRSHSNRKDRRIAGSCIEELSGYPVKTITYDNGKEFTQHQRIASKCVLC